MQQFAKWFGEAAAAEIRDVNAMSLATIASDGMPACRIVLLKAISDGGFVFYTNYHSAKARDRLGRMARAALTFFWTQLSSSGRFALRAPVAESFARRVGGIFSIATNRQSARRVGFESKRSDREPRRA